jgi:diguanylate cyclase (GGDEF)-like protein
MRQSHPELHALLRSASNLLGTRLELSAARGEDSHTAMSSAEGATAAVRSERPLEEKERLFLRDLLSLVEKDLLVTSTDTVIERRIDVLEKENAELLMKNLSLSESATRDLLTGLFSRSYAVEKIEEEMNRAWRHGRSMSLLMIDVDRLKMINERHGLSAGDQVLKTIGEIIRGACRVYDVPARFAGEQFCVLLPDTPVSRTHAVAERIRHAIESRPIHTGHGDVAVTCSIGIAGLDNIPEAALFNSASLLERADRALFFAKDRGRNRIEAWTPSLAVTARQVPTDH